MLLVPLALVGIGLFLLARAWAAEGAATALARRLLDLAVRDPAEARRLLREHPELLGARYLHDQTALHWCAIEGLADGVRFFAAAGVPVDAANRFGDTPLLDAAALGHLDVVRILLRLGADPNATSPLREQVLHVAVSHGHAQVVAALLDAGARPDYVTSQGGRIGDAIPKAPRLREEVVKVLKDHGVRGSSPEGGSRPS